MTPGTHTDFISRQALAVLWQAALRLSLPISGETGVGASLRLSSVELENYILDYIEEVMPTLASVTSLRRRNLSSQPFGQWLISVSDERRTSRRLRIAVRNALQHYLEGGPEPEIF